VGRFYIFVENGAVLFERPHRRISQRYFTSLQFRVNFRAFFRLRCSPFVSRAATLFSQFAVSWSRVGWARRLSSGPLLFCTSSLFLLPLEFLFFLPGRNNAPPRPHAPCPCGSGQHSMAYPRCILSCLCQKVGLFSFELERACVHCFPRSSFRSIHFRFHQPGGVDVVSRMMIVFGRDARYGARVFLAPMCLAIAVLCPPAPSWGCRVNLSQLSLSHGSRKIVSTWSHVVFIVFRFAYAHNLTSTAFPIRASALPRGS